MSTHNAGSTPNRNVAAASAPLELHTWLDAIAEIARAVNRALPLKDLLDLIAGTTCHLTGYDFCGVLLEDPDRECLVIEGSYGLSAAYVANINARCPIRIRSGALGEGPSSRAYRSQRPVALIDIHDDPTCLPWEVVASEQGYHSLLSVPLVVSHAPLGLLNCYTAQRHTFSPREVLLTETIANQAAIAIEATDLRARERARIAELVQLNQRLEEGHAALQRAESVHRDLMRVLLEGEGVDGITRALADMLLCDVVVEDVRGQVIAASTPEGRPCGLPPEYADLLGQRPAEAAGARHTAEIPADVAEPRGRPALVTPVVLDDEIAGRIWAFHPQEAFKPFDRRSLERGAIVVALALLRVRTAQEVEWRLSRDFLDDLLATDRRATEGLLARARQLGTDLSVPHAVVVARHDPPDTAGDTVLRADDDARARRSLLALAQRRADRSGTPALTATRGDHVVVLWPEEGGQTDAAAFAEELRREIRAYAAGWTASVALGPRCDDAAEYGDAYRLACGALDLVQGTGRRERIVSLDDLGVYRLLLQVKRPRELAAFARSVLGPLHDYDGRREIRLVETLQAYMGRGCSTALAAEALNVHANTVSYRLRRIQELL
ncbi:MAG: GAF domain-containing protein, partial [Nitriliruptorales bacterium]|nr:GAF domain-containing protein [Nitriliruptorales bacterium]